MITPRRLPAGPGDVARHYDELDAFYRGLWGEHLHHGLFESGSEDPRAAAERLVDRVAGLAGLRPGMTVCDVGCGYGATARKLAREQGLRVVGLTLSAAQLEYARTGKPSSASSRESNWAGSNGTGSSGTGSNGTGSNGTGPNRTGPTRTGSTHFLRADWLRAPFAAASFDAVIAIECLTHMNDQRRFFVEAARALRPGGRLVVCAWLAAESAGPLRRRLLLEPICTEGELPGMGTADETHTFIREAGLEPIRFRDLSRRVRRTWSIVARRVATALLRDPEARRLVTDPSVRSRHFARSVLRIWAAYRTGAMRYGVFVARKPSPGTS